MLGGSFSAGGAVADMRDSYAEVLAALLSGTHMYIRFGRFFWGVCTYIHRAVVLYRCVYGRNFLTILT